MGIKMTGNSKIPLITVISGPSMNAMRPLMALALAAGVVVPSSAGAAEDWLLSIQNEKCSDESKAKVAQNSRDKIEAAVRRGEAAIQAPAPLEDLGCLSDLLNTPVTFFSNMGNVAKTLQAGLQNGVNMKSLGIDVDVSGLVCKVAAEKFATLTEPLSGSFQGLASMAGNPYSRASGGVNGAFSQIASIPETLGAAMSGTSSESASVGSLIGDYTVPDFSYVASNPVVEQTYPDSGAYDGSSGSSSSEWGSYYQRMMINLANYQACRSALEMHGAQLIAADDTIYTSSSTLLTPAASKGCVFGKVSTPSYASYSSADAVIASTPVVADVVSADVDRSASMATSSTVTDSATGTATAQPQSIWEELLQ